MNFAVKGLISLGALAALLLPALPVFSKMTAVTKFTNTATGKTTIFFPTAPNSEITVNSVGAPVAKNFTTDACGMIKIKSSATSQVQSFSGAGVSSSGAAGDDPPVCSGGKLSYELPVGMTVIATGAYGPDYYARVDSTSVGGVTISVTYQKAFKIKGGECGLGKVTVSETRPMTAFGLSVPIGGQQDFTLANLPATTAPDVCRAPFSGAPKILYTPAQ